MFPTPSSLPLPNRIQAGLLLIGLMLTAAAATAQPTRAQEPPEQIPCSPSFSRSMMPLTVEQGGTADVAVHIDYDCRQRSQQTIINVMLVINSAVPDDFNNVAGLERQLRAGLGGIINLLPWENGSRMGLVLFDDDALVRSTLRSDPGGTGGHRQALSQLAQNFQLGTGSAAGFDQAISLAYRQLPVLQEGEVNAIVAFHAGPNDLTVGNWCRQADRVGVTITGVQVASGGGLMGPCMNAGLRTVPDDGTDLDTAFEDIGNALFRGDTIDQVLITDAMRGQYIDYVQGSSNLVEPTNPFAQDYEWELPGGNNPPGGRTLTYQIRILDDDPGLAPDQLELSLEARAFIIYASGSQQDFDLHLPRVCLARSGMLAEDCGSFETPTPTPSATLDLPTQPPTETSTPGPATETPVATVTPTPSATLPGPTATPTIHATTTAPVTEPPTATDPPHSWSIHLPLLLGDAEPAMP